MASKKLLYSYTLFLVILLVISGCASSNTSSGNSSGIQAGPGVNLTTKTITLGILSPYSGPVAQPIGIP
ncbi:MAG: hypothetical protein ACRDHW_18705, partial [Ktedonobacteraceae bacterium]